MIAARLNDILTWYNEAHADLTRPELLAKLATLELCGWIEEELDSIIRDVATASMNDAVWTHDNIIKKNSGFTYDGHVRQMLGKLAGELLVRRIEAAVEAAQSGDLAQLRSQLTLLYSKRCALAHTALANAQQRQYTLDAPSLTLAHYNNLSVLLSRFRRAVVAELGRI